MTTGILRRGDHASMVSRKHASTSEYVKEFFLARVSFDSAERIWGIVRRMAEWDKVRSKLPYTRNYSVDYVSESEQAE